ncbi:hypothetical protein CTA1_6883 [Colletotrichum tanaceti]|uniref:Uncharacterized protein n=1 Tax=Colletotrichum tanaceti TaxID=1306861 RepID=A0A4V6DHJ6_9PEZI|nr:hypothetical protein CTA1_6883 [Colletotrichum tanaceti]
MLPVPLPVIVLPPSSSLLAAHGIELVPQLVRELLQDPLALLLAAHQRRLRPDPGPLVLVGVLALPGALVAPLAVLRLLLRLLRPGVDVRARLAVRRGAGLVLADELQVPRPLGIGVPPRGLLFGVLSDGGDLGDEEEVEVCAGGWEGGGGAAGAGAGRGPGEAVEEGHEILMKAALAWQDRDVAQLEGGVADGLDDGVAGVGDHDGHGRQGQQGPEDEEGLAGVGDRGAVAVADGGQGDEGEVEAVKVGPALVGPLALLKDLCADEPEDEPGGEGDGHGHPAAADGGLVLDRTHEVELPLAALELGGGGRRRAWRRGRSSLGPLMDGLEDVVFALADHAQDEVAALLLDHAGVEAAAAALEDEGADGADDETEADDADESVGDEQGTAERGGGGVVPETDGEEGDVSPVDGVEVGPALDGGEDKGAEEEIEEEEDGLQHEGALGGRELEILGVVAGVGAVDGDDHEGGGDEVEDGGEHAVEEGLGEDVLVGGLEGEGPGGGGVEGDEADGREVPADDGDGLGEGEAHAAGHVEEEEDVGDDCYGKLDGVDDDEPAGGCAASPLRILDKGGGGDVGARREALSPRADEGAYGKGRGDGAEGAGDHGEGGGGEPPAARVEVGDIVGEALVTALLGLLELADALFDVVAQVGVVHGGGGWRRVRVRVRVRNEGIPNL